MHGRLGDGTGGQRGPPEALGGTPRITRAECGPQETGRLAQGDGDVELRGSVEFFAVHLLGPHAGGEPRTDHGAGGGPDRHVGGGEVEALLGQPGQHSDRPGEPDRSPAT